MSCGTLSRQLGLELGQLGQVVVEKVTAVRNVDHSSSGFEEFTEKEWLFSLSLSLSCPVSFCQD